MQLTGTVEAIMSRKNNLPIPTAVLIVKGKLHEVVQSTLQALIGSLHLDPSLDIARATGAILGTAGDLFVRLDQYRYKYPYKSCLMCKVWFPGSYRANVEAF